MQVPAIHLNGTGRDGLLKSYSEAAHAVREALAKLAWCTPHMRDYYIMDDAQAAFDRAQREHFARADRLQSVLTELDELMAAIVDTD